MRHPGGLHRIHGFVVDEADGDLVLLGSRDGPGDPIDLEDLIVGLRAVWRDGSTPICSLEPTPGDMGGVQRAIVAGVDADSHFARVMLDADYRLKTLLLGDRAPDGFKNLRDLVTAQMAQGVIPSWTARFWFTPVQPGEGEIRLSRDERAALFNSTIQVLTEDMRATAGGLVGTGSQDPLMAEATGQFTRQFGSLEREEPLVAQLHGLFDIVLLAKVLRTTGARVPVMERLLRLPAGTGHGRDSYPGLTMAVETGGIAFFHMVGGVSIAVNLNSSALTRSDDPALNRLPGKPPRGDSTLPIPTHRAAVSGGGENELVDAGRFAAGGDSMKALSLLDGLLSRDPADAEGHKLRSRIYARMGLHRLAQQEWLAAARLNPGDSALGALRIQLALERGDPVEPGVLAGPAGDRVAELYQTEASQRQVAGAPAAALESLDKAIGLRPDRADFLEARAGVYAGMGRWPRALEDVSQAIRLGPGDAGPYLLRSQVFFRMRNPQAALADAARAIALKPGLAAAYILRASVEASLTPPDSNAAYADVRRASALEPNNPQALMLQARLLQLEGDRDGTLSALNRVVRLYPGMAAPYALRAAVLAETVLGTGDIRTNQGTDALAMLGDLTRAVALDPADTGSRLLRVDLVLAYAADIGDPEVRNWDAVLPLLIKGSMMNCPAVFQKIAQMQSPSGRDDAERNLVLWKSAAALFAIYELEDMRASAGGEQRAQIQMKIDSLRAALK